MEEENKNKKEYLVYETCADCAYHHCKFGCKKRGKCSGGECLYLGIKKQCDSKRCEHFKEFKYTNE